MDCPGAPSRLYTDHRDAQHAGRVPSTRVWYKDNASTPVREVIGAPPLRACVQTHLSRISLARLDTADQGRRGTRPGPDLHGLCRLAQRGAAEACQDDREVGQLATAATSRPVAFASLRLRKHVSCFSAADHTTLPSGRSEFDARP